MKTVELDWEKVPGAMGYQVKLVPVSGGKALLFTTTANHLSQEIPAGDYQLQIRSRAEDGEQFSQWSKAIPFEAVTKIPMPIFPADQSTINAKTDAKQPLEFKWSPVDQVQSYTLKLWTDSTEKTPYTFTTTATKKKLGLIPGRVYHWQVLFKSLGDVSYQQNPKTFDFTLQGPHLLKPDIDPHMKTTDVTALNWLDSPGASHYKVKLFFHYLDETAWTPVLAKTVTAPPWPLKELKPGAYKIEVTASAPHRADSETAVKEFVVKPTEAEMKTALTDSF